MNTYTAVTKQNGDWWIGWIEEVPGVNCQERTHEELIASLEMILLQIANLESENDIEAIEIVKEGVNKQGVLMEINLTDLRHSFREKNESRSLKQPSTQPQTF